MKKVLPALVAFSLSLTFISPASAITAVTGLKKITVASVAIGSARDPQVLDIGKGRTLVSWVEEKSNQTYSLKTKVVSATNKLGKVITVNPALASSNMNMESLPQITVSSKGKLFAAWVQRTSSETTVTDRVFGRTSTNGTTWSKVFAISQPVVADKAYCEDSAMDGCGVGSLQISVDGAGRTGVLVSTVLEEGIHDYKATVTSRTSKWPALKLLGTVANQISSEIVGLTQGFAVSWMDYTGGQSCANKVAHFDPKTSKWGSTLLAQNIQKNTVVFSKWVQRDSKTLTLVMGSQLEQGGITIRNFSLVSKKWTGVPRLVIPSEPSVVFQNISAAAKGKALAIGYTTYNQQSAVSQARMILQKSTTGAFSSRVLENGVDQIDPVFAGFSKSGEAFFVYNELSRSSRLTKFKSSAKPMDLPGRTSVTYTSDVSISSSDLLSAVSISYSDDKATVTLVKGRLR
jgi:hypothetical protein